MTLTNKEPKHKKIRELRVNGQPTAGSMLVATEFNHFCIQSVEELAQRFDLLSLNNIEREDLPN